MNSGEPQVMRMKLRDPQQLFNSMDPTPFPERDLDDNAEAFIVSWAKDLDSNIPFRLEIMITNRPPVGGEELVIETAVQHYFEYKYEIAVRDFGQWHKIARRSLLIGVTFLGVCMFAATLVHGESALYQILRESLFILGWVAMWRPLEMMLYDWWPLRRMTKTYAQLSDMDVTVNYLPTESIPIKP